ncbi:MAG: NAD(P)-dependent oxidoreductase [Bacteroidales bacterium]
MPEPLKIGILRETKIPPDKRVPLTPAQIITLGKIYPWCEFIVQPSPFRCFSDNEYQSLGIPIAEDLQNCNILLGVKEIDTHTVIPDKTYMFFAHVGKKQSQNRDMFRNLSRNHISLIDYEYLKTENGERVVAFGRYAGIVGAYNALRASGIKSKTFDLKPAHQHHDLANLWDGLRRIDLTQKIKILVTGKGRVANGTLETLSICNIRQVSPDEYLNRDFNEPVVCQIGPESYVRHRNGQVFNFPHFVSHPGEYESTFLPFTKVTDVLIAGHYWDPRSPVFFTTEDMKNPGFRISVIADISCDINGPVPSTIRPATISDPFYDYDPQTGSEELPFSRPSNITVMSVDNLPGELPRDASLDFGKHLMNHALHDLFSGKESRVITRATILKNGSLSPAFEYLFDYLGDV